MKNTLITLNLREMGFVEGIRDKNDYYADLGAPVNGLVYLTRKHKDQFQYVSLCGAHDEDRFLEAVVHIYQFVFNSRAKVQQPLLHVNIHRNLDELVAALDKIYELPKKVS